MKCLNHGKGLDLGYSEVCVCVCVSCCYGEAAVPHLAIKSPFGPRFIQNTGMAFSEEPFRSVPLV